MTFTIFATTTITTITKAKFFMEDFANSSSTFPLCILHIAKVVGNSPEHCKREVKDHLNLSMMDGSSSSSLSFKYALREGGCK